MRFEKETFTNDVTLDCNEFIDCTISNCALLHAGGPFSLTRTTLTNVRFGIGGPAQNTLAFIRLILAQGNGEQLLRELLQQGPQPEQLKTSIN
jgi:hypothetical protein